MTDWNGAGGNFRFYWSGDGSITINTYYADDNLGGYTNYGCGGNPVVLGNVFYYHSANVTHAYAGHELGHGARLGHISDPEAALMGNNPDAEQFYTPQWRDSELIQQVYP